MELNKQDLGAILLSLSASLFAALGEVLINISHSKQTNKNKNKANFFWLTGVFSLVIINSVLTLLSYTLSTPVSLLFSYFNSFFIGYFSSFLCFKNNIQFTFF